MKNHTMQCLWISFLRLWIIVVLFATVSCVAQTQSDTTEQATTIIDMPYPQKISPTDTINPLIADPTSPQSNTEVGILPYQRIETHDTTSDFGSGSDEFSAVTFNQENNHLIIVDDGTSKKPSRFYDYVIDENMIPDPSSLKIYDIEIIDEVGNRVTDIEGVAWMYNNTYSILSEGNSAIYLIDLNDPKNKAVITTAYHTIPTGIEAGNNGAEGIAFEWGSATETNPFEAVFYVVKEKNPTTLHKITWNGPTGDIIPITGLADLSDVYYAENNQSIYIVSHKGNHDSPKSQGQLIQLSVDWDSQKIVEQSAMSLDNFYQAEGITFNKGLTTMVIVGETKDHENDTYNFIPFKPLLSE